MDKVKNFFKSTGSLFKTNLGSMIFVIAATFLLTLLLFGGGGSAETEKAAPIPAGTSDTTDTQSQTADSAPAETPAAGTLGKYDVEIKGFEIKDDWEGNPAIVVSFAFVNNSEDPQSFEWAISQKAYQNGTQLDVAVVDGVDYSKEILPGYSTDATMAFKLQDATNPVLVTCTELISLDDKKIEKTFNIA